MIKNTIRKLLKKMGYDVFRINNASHPLVRRRKLLAFCGIDVVLDVGANTGQFAQQMRTEIGFLGKIISFEPLNSEFKTLKEKACKDPKWETMRYALGDTNSQQEINIAGNSYSSSLLTMLASHVKAAPESKYVGKQTIEVKTLDSIFDSICSKDDNIYLKIDTQGFESKVIKGAEESLAHIDTIQVEMSLIPLYQDELLFNDMYDLLRQKDYQLVSIETGFADENTGQVFQVDGVFHRFSV